MPLTDSLFYFLSFYLGPFTLMRAGRASYSVILEAELPLEFLQNLKSSRWPRLVGRAVGLKIADKAESSLLILGHSLCHQSLSMGDVCVAAQGRCLTPRALEMFLEKALFARCLWKPSSRHPRDQSQAEA